MSTEKERKSRKRELRQLPCENCGRMPQVDENGKSIDPYTEIQPAKRITMNRGISDLGRTASELLDVENLIGLCAPCVRYKGEWTLEELRDRRFVQWRHVGDEDVDLEAGGPRDAPQGALVEWPNGYDADTGEWFTHERREGARAHMIAAGDAGERMPFPSEDDWVEVRHLARWVRGVLFDYPLPPDVAMPEGQRD